MRCTATRYGVDGRSRTWSRRRAGPDVPLAGRARPTARALAGAEPMARSWICGRCRVRTSFSPGADEPGKPEGWIRVDGEWRCLACRRTEVLDAAAITGASGAATTRRRALAEFEPLRNPSSSDRVIAKLRSVGQRSARWQQDQTKGPMHMIVI